MTRPTTRSLRSHAISGQENGEISATPASTGAPDDAIAALETHLSGLTKAIRILKRDYTSVKQKNDELTADLEEAREQLEANVQPKRGRKGKEPTTAQLQRKNTELKARIRELEKSRAKDRRKIARLQEKEIKRDADDLQDGAEFDGGDVVHKMRKLLRRFHDLMLTNSLGESEECHICFTEMELGKATSLPCQHVFCTECIKQLAASQPGDADTFPCPICRDMTNIDDAEIVEMTSSAQWDALLEIANESAKLDRRRGELDTSDEEAEEEAANNFIEDDEGTSEDAQSEGSHQEEPEDGEADDSVPASSSSKGRRLLRLVTPPETDEPVASGSGMANINGENPEDMEVDAPPSTPHPNTLPGPSTTPSYTQSPMAEKKRRLEELADARAAKDKKRRFG